MRLFLALFLLPSLSFSADLKVPPAGAYLFQDNFEVLSKKKYQTVYGFTNEGRAQLSKLRGEGFVCSNTGREIFLCSAFEPEKGTEGEVENRVLAKLKNAKIEFSAEYASPSLLSKGTSIEMWLISQKVSFNSRAFESYRYLINEDLHKIFLGEPAQETFIILDDGRIAYPFSISVTESREVYRNYFVMAFFRM